VDRSGRIPTDAEIGEINATHLINTPLKRADLLFVFGTRVDEVLRAEEAVRLRRAGLFRWAIVSGGVTPGSARSECAVIKEEMVRRGIPADCILEEHRAMNTGENVLFSLPLIDAALGLANIKTVICLGNTWTGRRYAMTLHRHWPEVEKMLATVDSFATPRALWHADPEFRRRVLREWDKTEPYKARGFIAEWPS
jgi:uncharacterized SAM-binding protein YcdF (DUF218 family)